MYIILILRHNLVYVQTRRGRSRSRPPDLNVEAKVIDVISLYRLHADRDTRRAT